MKNNICLTLYFSQKQIYKKFVVFTKMLMKTELRIFYGFFSLLEMTPWQKYAYLHESLFISKGVITTQTVMINDFSHDGKGILFLVVRLILYHAVWKNHSQPKQMIVQELSTGHPRWSFGSQSHSVSRWMSETVTEIWTQY